MQGVMKQSVLRNGTYVLAKKEDGSHFEEFFHNQTEFAEAGELGRLGVLGGHKPEQGKKYSCRPYFHHD